MGCRSATSASIVLFVKALVIFVVCSCYFYSLQVSAGTPPPPPPPAPTISPGGGTYGSSLNSYISGPSGQHITIRYTTNGSTPTSSSPIYSGGAIPITQNKTVKTRTALRWMDRLGRWDYVYSAMRTAIYYIRVATPTVSPASGAYFDNTQVSISSASGTATYYTTDNSTPTTSSNLYTGPFVLGPGENTVKAISVKTNFSNSTVASAVYTRSVSEPTISPNGGNHSGPVLVSLTTNPSDADIYYTTDGSTPTSSSTQYLGPFSIEQNVTVKAIGIKSGYADSVIADASFNVSLAAPTISPGGGSIAGTTPIVLSSPTPGVNIYYTTDGTTPTTSSTQYTIPFTIATSSTVKAIAMLSGFSDSAVSSASFTVSTTMACGANDGSDANSRITVPTESDDTTGLISGSHGVSSAGDVSYSIPIGVLPGTAGVEPKLSIEYNSGGGNGIMGLGFQLSGLSAIQRCGDTIVQDGVFASADLNGGDKYCIDGARLIAVNGAYGANGTEYRTEINSFNKIVSNGSVGSGPASFTVWTKSGEILEYGNTGDSRMDIQGHAVIWGLNKLSDTAGNYFTVEYDEVIQINPDQGGSVAGISFSILVPDEYEMRPKRIEYTGNPNSNPVLNPDRYIDFVYQNNVQDAVSKPIGTNLIKSDSRLTSISIKQGTTEHKNYKFAYTTRGVNPALLDSVTECYRDASQIEKCLPATTFDWHQSSGSVSFSAPQDWPAGNDIISDVGDFDGDGLADLLIRDPEPTSTAPYKIYVRKSTGSAFGPKQVVATYSVTASSVYECDPPIPWQPPNCYYVTYYTSAGSGHKFSDFNGDGKADLVYSASSGQLKVGISTGSGVGAIYNVSHRPVADFNGDGKNDALYFEQAQHGNPNVTINNPRYLYLKTSTGTGLSAPISIGTLDTQLGCKTGQTQGTPADPGGSPYCIVPTMLYGDIDGDGRADLATSRETKYVDTTYFRRSKGHGFLSPLILEGIVETYSHLVGDVNGDGLDDYVYISSPNVYVRLSTGLTMGGQQLAAIWNNIGSQSRLQDVNGDGRKDLITWGGSQGVRVLLSQSSVPDLLTKITDGLGTEVTFTYATLMDSELYTPGTGSVYPERDLRSSVDEYLVKQVRVDNGIGGTLTTSYKYEGGRIHHEGHGHLGFEKVTETDDATGIKTITTYRQDYPYIGETERVETRKATDELLAETDITYHEFTGNIISQQPLFPRATSKVEKTYDFDNQQWISTVTSSTTYDAYGNAELITVSTEDHTTTTSDGYKTVTQNWYDHDDVSKWFLGRLSKTVVTKSKDGTDTKVRTSTFEYDATTGFLAKEIVEPNTDYELIKTYEHDVWGNQKKVTTSSGSAVYGIVSRDSQTVFDAQGRFRVSSTNAKGHVETYQVNNHWGGVTKLTGPNLLETNWEYDAQGRKIKEIRADGTQTNIYYNWCNSTCPSQVNAIYKVTTTSSITSTGDLYGATSVVYFDKLGRKVLTETENFDGTSVYVQTQYDARGRSLRVSQPYDTNAQYWTTYSYDDLDRVTQESSPVTGITMSDYDGLLTTVTNDKGQKTYEEKNALGWTMWTEDNNLQRVTFTYDSRGNLRTVTDPDGNIKNNTYNVLDQKETMDDPDMGLWKYEYNVLGELTKQWDAKTPHNGPATVVMTYDVLGRLIQRDEPEGQSNWTYDDPDDPNNPDPLTYRAIGKLVYEASPNFSRSFTFDALGRAQTTSTTIDGVIHTSSVSYDSAGRTDIQTYPTGYQVMNVYNEVGFLEKVLEPTGNCDVHWQAFSSDEYGNITVETLANGNTLTVRDFEDNSGRLFYVNTNVGAVQNLSYVYDPLGNLLERQEIQGATTLHEKFTYDNLNRLDSVEFVGVGTYQAATYDALGNITSKYNVGTYNYTSGNAGPHAVQSVSGTLNTNFTYDANGNMETGNGRSITWSSFNKPIEINANGNTVKFEYGPDRARFKQEAGGDTTLYIGGSFEKVIKGPLTENKHFIRAGGNTIAIHTTREGSQTNSDSRYLHRDHLGSIDAITDELGNVVERHSYDAFGQRRESDWQTALGSLTSVITTRGFTGHEMLDGVGLIHMNGRVYDPLLGRFLSADPHIQSPLNLQSHNRYSYVLNNPLSYTDPSGFFFKSLFKKIAKAIKRLVRKITRAIRNFIKKYGRTIAAIAISYYAPGVGLNSFTAGFASGLVASGGDIKAAIVGGVTAYAFTAAGDHFASIANKNASYVAGANAVTGAAADTTAFLTAGQQALKTATHGAIGGLSSLANGGKFGQGFVSAGVTQGFSRSVDSFDKGIQRVAAASVLGGTASVASGGKFQNGAVTAAFSRSFNDELHLEFAFRTPRWLGRVIFGSDYIGQGFAVGGVVSFPGFYGGEYDAGVYGTAFGGGEDIGTGKYTIGLGYGKSDARGLTGKGSEFNFNDGIGGLSVGLDNNDKLSSVGLHIGPGVNIGGSGTITKSYTIRDGVDFVKEKFK